MAEQFVLAPKAFLLIVIVVFLVVAMATSRRRKNLNRQRYEVIVCPNCGTSQPSHAAFCRRCGERV